MLKRLDLPRMLGLNRIISIRQAGVLYWTARSVAALFIVAAGFAFSYRNGLAGLALLFCGASWTLTSTVVWVWLPRVLVNALRQHTIEVVQARALYPDAGEDGMEGNRLWLRDIAGRVGLGVRFKDAPDGTPNVIVELYDAPDSVIGVRPR